jgi:two-component system sensor histidine kinase DesK
VNGGAVNDRTAGDVPTGPVPAGGGPASSGTADGGAADGGTADGGGPVREGAPGEGTPGGGAADGGAAGNSAPGEGTLGERAADVRAASDRSAHDAGRSGGRWHRARELPTRIAAAILGAAQVSYAVAALVTSAGADTTVARRTAGVLLCLVAAALQVPHSARSTRLYRERWGVASLAAQTAAAWGVVACCGRTDLAVMIYPAASALLILPGAWAWSAFAAEPVGATAYAALVHAGAGETLYCFCYTFLTGLTFFGLTRLPEAAVALRDTHDDLAWIAVGQERLRFARDLHDLLGYGLSAITLKGELTARLVERDPARARAELDEILEISRQALADVRTVAGGYRDMALADEVASARSVLSAAGIEARIRADAQPAPGLADTVMATVLREGVTNLLRHSRARGCEISTVAENGVFRLTLINDGAPARLSPRDGNGGLDNLAARTAAIGGKLTTRHTRDGTFLLTAEAPLVTEGD